MTQNPSLLIAGCGDLGTRLAHSMLDNSWQVYGLRRSTGSLSTGIIPIAGNLAEASLPKSWPTHRLDYVVYCVAAQESSESAYKTAYVTGLAHLCGWLAHCQQQPRRLLFVSSTSVYGQQDGAWVDEDTPTQANNYSGQILLEAERYVEHLDYPGTVVRLTGIYGPGRQALINQVYKGYLPPSTPCLYGNRIHVDDAASLLAFLLSTAERGGTLDRLYLGVDDNPAPLHDVVTWLRTYLNISNQTSSRRLGRTSSKRCRNTRIRALGWTPRYPSYREGYATLLTAVPNTL